MFAHILIEEERHRNIDKKHKICTHCNMSSIENEYDFSLVSPFYREIRTK
jgi:hypothetical protein